MAYVRCGFLTVLFGGLLFMGGCITAEQRERLNVLAAENEALALKQRELVEKIRTGTATPADVAEALQSITVQMKKNVDEIKAIKDSGSTGAWLAAAAGLLGRTVLHAAGAAIPGGTPVAAALQGLLTLLLGGSETKRKEAA